MSVCEHCHENVAVIYTGQPNAEANTYKGYCLSCALRYPELKLQHIVKNSGITEENVDMVTDHLNRMMEPMRDDPPEVLMEKMQEIMSNIDPTQIMQQIAEFLPEQGDASDPENLDTNEMTSESDDESREDSGNSQKTGDGQKSGEHGGTASKDSENQEKHKPFNPFKNGAPGFAAFGDKSVSDALQMMLSGIMGGGPGNEGLMPAARGSESDADSLAGDGRATEGPRVGNGAGKRETRGARRQRKFLDTFGTNLIEKARSGQMDPIIGREKELERVIQILNRRMKNNPVLLGEPGVGKTAIAEGLAMRIANGDVPAKLLNMEVYLLDMTAMVAGTQFRGQFESRMKGLVDEARKLGNIILVIDELHNIMGAGDAEGAMNAANILKPSLAKGEVRVLGSTTLSEYRRFIEKDSALERRFQQVIVEEPDREACIEILRGLRPKLEEHHHITLSDDVINYVYELADRYVSGRYFPDKAIDIIDEAGSAANLKDVQLVEHAKLVAELEQARREKSEQDAVLKTDEDEQAMFERQAKQKAKILSIEASIQKLEEEMRPSPLTRESVANVVQMWTGIPVRKISEDESGKLLKLEERLNERVIGQNKAVTALARAIRRSRAGLGKRHKPASFIFVGPTGVGKTELVKALGWALFDQEDSIVRLDMSEYMEAHTVSKLIGSPPGYVGYDDAGQLTEKIRRHPYSVILLDEIEKAHADVFNILLQILDDGRLTDSHGRTVNFEHTVIVMTSNAGTSVQAAGIGFGRSGGEAREAQVQAALKDIFRPEFLNRVDEIVVFETLSRGEIREIVELMLKECEENLKERGIRLRMSDAAKDRLAIEGYDEKYGARPLRKCIQRRIEDPLADLILDGGLEGKTAVGVDYKDGEFVIDTL